jgi:regulatory protein
MSVLPSILQKARRYCTYQERSQQEVRDKLYELGLHRREVEQAIGEMIAEGFLSEQRFATAFAGGKFRTKGWGRNKIKQALQMKKVSSPCISHALKEIEHADYQKVLNKILTQKLSSTVEKNPLKKNYKVAQYAISRGFEPELVWDALKEINA